MDNMEIEGFVAQREALDRLMMSNPNMEKKVQSIIRKVLLHARRTISQSAKSKMKSDPRDAYKAVKTSVYRRVLGGSVSLYNRKKRAEGPSSYEPPRRLKPHQRGGNRVPRSQRTQDVMSYQGADRAFILRFLEGGTTNRMAGSRNGRLSGNRGSIAARNFFGTTSQQAMESAASELDSLINELIQAELSK